jgi:hypothetical protein
MLLMECDDPDSPLGDVYIYMVEEDIPEQQAAENLPATRSREVPAEGDGTESYGTEGEGNATVVDGVYGVFAYQGSGNVPETYTPGEGVVPFQDIQNLSLNSLGKYEGEDIYAPGAGFWLQFIAYAPYRQVAATEESTDNPALFANVGYPSIRYVATPELAKTTDLLFGGRRGTDGKLSPISGDLNSKDGVTPAVALNMSHILSKVRINSSALAGTITSIKITGIKNSGIYNYHADNLMTWDLTGSDKQEYVYIGDTDNSEEYFLLPQELAEDAKLEIKVVVPVPNSDPAQTREYTLTKNLKTLGSWAPNKQYTYTITTPQEVAVTVTDKVETIGGYPVKSDLKITNTGLSDAYIRVAIVGAWMVNDIDENNKQRQVMVADWKPEEDGDFIWSGDVEPKVGVINSSKWTRDSNGYYYYTDPLRPGKDAPALFDSYTLTATAPMVGAYLELQILVQAVHLVDRDKMFPQFVSTLCE